MCYQYVEVSKISGGRSYHRDGFDLQFRECAIQCTFKAP